jgi:hypothetical protein
MTHRLVLFALLAACASNASFTQDTDVTDTDTDIPLPIFYTPKNTL